MNFISVLSSLSPAGIEDRVVPECEGGGEEGCGWGGSEADKTPALIPAQPSTLISLVHLLHPLHPLEN